MAIGCVTTKEDHSRFCIDYVDFMARYTCNDSTWHYTLLCSLAPVCVFVWLVNVSIIDDFFESQNISFYLGQYNIADYRCQWTTSFEYPNSHAPRYDWLFHAGINSHLLIMIFAKTWYGDVCLRACACVCIKKPSSLTLARTLFLSFSLSLSLSLSLSCPAYSTPVETVLLAPI